MNIVWFWTLAAMLAAYAVLDGYDLGVGAVHLWLARGDQQRRRHLSAIGPVWNGNEVWLIAAGGMMVMAFPRLYAAAFSGFYLALIVVLWLLVLRGISIEFRGQIKHPLWSSFWDAGFWLASLLLALLLGVALGNVVRGLPLGPDGYFIGSFTLMLNPFAMLIGLLSLAVLSWHGVNFMRTKAEGEQLQRARAWSQAFWWVALGFTLAASAAAILAARPQLPLRFLHHPEALAGPLVLAFGFVWSSKSSDHRAFTGSAMVIVGLLGAAAATVYPALLPSRINPAFSLTIYNAANSSYGLAAAFIANGIALAGVVAYSIYIHRRFRGRTPPAGHHY